MEKQNRINRKRNNSGISDDHEIQSTKIRISCNNTVSEIDIKSFELERFYVKQENSDEYKEILAYQIQEEVRNITLEYKEPTSLWQYFKKLILIPMMRGNDWHIKTKTKSVNIKCLFKYYVEVPSELSDGTDKKRFVYMVILNKGK